MKRDSSPLACLMAFTGNHSVFGGYHNGGAARMQSLPHAEWTGPQKGTAKPYHGYYFRVLDAQGSNVPEGAHNYVVKDKMIGGFALVAWPAEYGVTGIHTFIVNQDGVVYQKDIEPVPGKPFPPVTRFDPDSSWTPVE